MSYDVVKTKADRIPQFSHGYTDQRAEVHVRQFTFVLLPNVYHPDALSTIISMDAIGDDIAGKTVLDIGCGCGILGITALYRGARHVTFTDLNPDAIANTKENLAFHRMQKRGTALRSDLFSKLKGQKFDRILFNIPFLFTETELDDIPGDITEMIKRSMFDPGYRVCAKFYEQVRDHLKPGGFVQVSNNSVANQPLIDKILADNKMKKTVVHTVKNQPGVLADSINWFVFRIEPKPRK